MKSFVEKTVFVLVVLGAFNWGLVGVFDYNVVSHVFGAVPTFVQVLYILIGLAAVVTVFKRYVKK